MEIDGASNRKIEDIRELREAARFTPVRSRHKIYIIDEVHQLTKDAFNALLKTLEEPPAHVIFIFATTELSKVPDTILSRCQSFEYRSISLGDIAEQLKMICDAEGINADDGAVNLLARRARGSMRDAQSLLDQAAAYGGGAVTAEDVQLILGMVDRGFIMRAMNGVVEQDRVDLLKLAEEVVYSGADPSLFLEDLTEVLRDVMAAKLGMIPDAPPDEKEQLKTWSTALEYADIQRLFAVVTETLGQMRMATLPWVNFEMGLLRMAEERGFASLDELLSQVEKAQDIYDREAPQTATPVPSTNLSRPADRSMASPAKGSDSSPPGASNHATSTSDVEPASFEIVDSRAKQAPSDLVTEFRGVKPSLYGIFEHSQVAIHDDAVVVTVTAQFEVEQLTEREIKEELEQISGRIMGQKMRLVVKLAGSDKKKDSIAVARSEDRDKSIRKQVADLPIIQSAIEIFNGEVIEVKLDN
jgi:DNA polymerase-3 subunit gamma/tau